MNSSSWRLISGISNSFVSLWWVLDKVQLWITGNSANWQLSVRKAWNRLSQGYFGVSQQFPVGADQSEEEEQLWSASGNIPVPKRLVAPSHLDSISCAVESGDALKHSESQHVVMFWSVSCNATGFISTDFETWVCLWCPVVIVQHSDRF